LIDAAMDLQQAKTYVLEAKRIHGESLAVLRQANAQRWRANFQRAAVHEQAWPDLGSNTTTATAWRMWTVPATLLGTPDCQLASPFTLKPWPGRRYVAQRTLKCWSKCSLNDGLTGGSARY
jgi:hypothetical protein